MDVLSPRQQDMMHLRCRCGWRWREVACALFRSPGTIKNHTRAIFRRMQTPSSENACWQIGYADGYAAGYRAALTRRARP